VMFAKQKHEKVKDNLAHDSKLPNVSAQ